MGGISYFKTFDGNTYNRRDFFFIISKSLKNIVLSFSQNHADDVEKLSTVIEEAVSYLTKKVDSKTRDIKVLQPTIATQTVTPVL
jgi:NADPH-dependent 7-cyano-7-deazaguanine reductase QueF-like protein